MIVRSDNIIEHAVILRNLNVNDYNTATDQQSPALTGYCCYVVYYEKPLAKDHYYYTKASYKYASIGENVPTWFGFYFQNGYSDSAKVDITTANTEYTVSKIFQTGYKNINLSLTRGELYHGPSNIITGVNGYVRNVTVYDVTDLFDILRTRGVVTTIDQLKTWCDTNLVHKPRYVNYDVTDLIDASSKLYQYSGAIIGNTFVETDGMQAYSATATIRNNTYFDTGSSVGVYNNTSGGAVSHYRVDAKEQNSPFWPEHKYVLKIVTDGQASPGCGGFVAHHSSAANKVFIEKFVAKIPIGYKVHPAQNPQGDNPVISVIGNDLGTGDWEEYSVLWRCGSMGTFRDGGYIYVYPISSSYSAQSVTWYVAYVNNCDVTGNEQLINFVAMPNKAAVKGGNMFANKFDNTNLLTNGDCAVQDPGFISSGWQYDTEDVAGNAKASIVQPIGASGGQGPTITTAIPIDPTLKYRISYWVKCKADMTRFLTAIYYQTSANKTLTHQQVMYFDGTKTTLTKDFKAGDTSITVASNENWKSSDYSLIGVRSSKTTVSYHDLGIVTNGSTGIVDNVEGSTVVNLTKAYTGETIPAGTVVCEGRDGGNYPYPVGKPNLPTNNEWKFVSGTFGADNAIFDGNYTKGWGGGIPFDTTHIKIALNLYNNDGTVPIKYADIRIEPITPNSGNRTFDKVQYSRI